MKSFAFLICVLLCGPIVAVAQPMDPELRTEFGVSAPAGVVGLRAVVPIGPNDTTIEPGAGFGLTGRVLSLIVGTKLIDFGSDFANSDHLRLYAGYGRSFLGSNRTFVASKRLHRGRYHWIETGVSRVARFEHFHFTGGIGVSVLLSKPSSFLADGYTDEDLYAVFPEWWVRKGVSPHLWTAIGFPF